MASMKVIHSAGGLVWRDGPDGREIAVIHRNRYDDWSLPKGKLDAGEHVLAAAVREVREETGTVAIPHVRLPRTTYLTGVPDVEKIVDFWSMQAVSTSQLESDEEVDSLRWLAPAAADGILTYAHDRGVLAAFTAMRPVTGIAVLIRHAHAGSRSGWAGPDERRPLDATGKRQAAALAPLLSLFQPTQVYAAPLTRCVDTVGQTGLVVRTDPVLAEATAAEPKAVADWLRTLVADGGRIVMASQGGVIPAAVAALKPPNVSTSETFATSKGSGWVLSFSGPDTVAADRLST